jgi:RHS repeat-associated protein
VSSADGQTTYTFDADGNLVQETSPSGITTYSYDDENRLIAVHKGSDTWTYAYDALGNRVATTENGATTRYVIDPVGLGNVVGEYTAGGSLIAHYDYGFGLLSSTSASGSSAYCTFDAIGNTSELTGAAGAIVNTYTYAPFGAVLHQTGSLSNPFQFVGVWGIMNEGNGLKYMRARYYSAQNGRFTCPDPIGIAGGVNIYQYAVNSPFQIIDPTGKQWALPALPDYRYWRFWWPEIPADSGAIPAQLDPDKGPDVPWPDLWPTRPDLSRFPFPPVPKPHTSPVLIPGYLPFVWPVPSGGDGTSKVPQTVDPNAKTSPAGFGPLGFISPIQTADYRIDFENEPSATAPAQQVTITDQLDSELDWTSFALTEIGFGDQFISVPANTQHFETTVPMTYNGTTFDVQIEAGIRADTGEVYATFRSIDPSSSLPPDVLVGFLPPEDGTGRGMGYFSYMVQPRSGLATGTEIRNVALISFDNQPEIATDQVDPHDPSKGTDPAKECLNTIDADPPTSNVLTLPSTVPANFTVSWAGQDDAGGSGIASYDIYVQDNGGAFTPWLTDTTQTSATYDGQLGHTYSFYSVTTDNVGNAEAAPAAPEATTTIVQMQMESKTLKKGMNSNTSWAFLDFNGTQAIITYSGLGQAVVERWKDSSGRGDIRNVTITGDNGTGTLTIITRGVGQAGITSVENIHVLGSFGSIIARTTSLLGSVTIDGALGRLAMGSAAAGSAISIGQAAMFAYKPVLMFDQVQDMAITSLSPIQSITCTDWLDTATTDVIDAPSLGTLTVTGKAANVALHQDRISGDFQAALHLSGSSSAMLPTLRLARIAGSLSGAEWSIDGKVGTIAVTGAVDGWTLHSDNHLLASLASLSLGDATDATVTVDGTLGRAVAKSWTSGAIVARALPLLMTRGDFGVDLTLTGAANPLANTLSRAVIGGSLIGGNWQVAGAAGLVIAKSASSSWSADLTGDSATLAGLMLTDRTATSSPSVSAQSIRTVNVLGSLSDAHFTLRQPVDARRQALGMLSVGGWMDASRITSVGTIGSVRAGGMRDSTVFAGVQNMRDEQGIGGIGDGVWDLPQVADLAAPIAGPLPGSMLRAGITSLRVGGMRENGSFVRSFINSNIAAGSLGRISLGYAQFDNTEVPFGLTTGTPATFSLTCRDAAIAYNYMWKKSDGANLPVWFDDLLLRMP